MSFLLRRPGNPDRTIPVEGHWGQNPQGIKPADEYAIPLVPVAPYWYDSSAKLWLPVRVGGDGVLVVDNLLENEYAVISVDLSTEREVPTEILSGTGPITGRSLIVWQNTGYFDLYFTDADHDPIPHEPLTWPAMIRYDREIASVFVRNDAQEGAQVVFYVGQRATVPSASGPLPPPVPGSAGSRARWSAGTARPSRAAGRTGPRPPDGNRRAGGRR